MSKKPTGVNLADIDASVRPQDDFYQYSNGGWIKNNPIPDNESRWGAFIILRYDTEQKLKKIVDELLLKRSIKKGSPEQQIRDLYRSGFDMKRRNALGVQPIAKMRKTIESIETVRDLQKVLANFHRIGVGAVFGCGIDQDAKDTTTYILHFFQDGLGMPDREYYLAQDTESVRVKTAYVSHVEAFFHLLGYTKDESKRRTAVVMDIETKLAKVSMNKIDRREIEKTYHKMTVRELQKLCPTIDWSLYLTGLKAKKIQKCIVMQPKFFSAVSRLLNTIPISDWKIYLEWQLTHSFGSLLSERFVKEQFHFYGTVMTGTKKMKPLWRRALSGVNGTLPDALGRIYVQKHFTPRAKKKMIEMVEMLFVAYRARIKNLDWMSPATKKKALHKLQAMNRKIGYPDKWNSYKGLVISPTEYVGNMVRASEREHTKQMKKLFGPIDRHEWFMSPQTVNAYNAPNMNEIVFPAAILQPPFFDVDGDEAYNYGAIGMTIAHEITHGFDDEGAKFDSKGNLKNWWTKEDKKRFEKKSKITEKQYNQYTVSDGVKVNGKLTLGENIADLGGVSIAYDAMKIALANTPDKMVAGFTREQRFFFGFSVFERENTRPEFEKMAALNDPHSPNVCRINGVVTNLPEFYIAFNVQKGDKLYRDSKDRAKIW